MDLGDLNEELFVPNYMATWTGLYISCVSGEHQSALQLTLSPLHRYTEYKEGRNQTRQRLRNLPSVSGCRIVGQ